MALSSDEIILIKANLLGILSVVKEVIVDILIMSLSSMWGNAMKANTTQNISMYKQKYWAMYNTVSIRALKYSFSELSTKVWVGWAS